MRTVRLSRLRSGGLDGGPVSGPAGDQDQTPTWFLSGPGPPAESLTSGVYPFLRGPSSPPPLTGGITSTYPTRSPHFCLTSRS